MEQGWGNLPQAFEEPSREREDLPAVDYNLFIFNNLKFSQDRAFGSTWHTNCSLHLPEPMAMVSGEKRILIIEPDPRERRDLAQLLKNENYDIETAKNLSEAIKKVAEGNFDCLVMDTHLPEMKGYEAVSILKNLDPRVRIIMKTKKNTKRLEAKVRQQAIFFYFIKSFGEEELKLAIKNAFRQ